MATSATGSEGAQKEKKTAQLPQCAQPVGTVALIEKDIPALEGTGLASPTTVMRLMITQSNCFQIVDEAVQATRRGKRGAQADYFLTADVISKNENAGGVDGSFGKFLPGFAGQMASSVSVKVQEAQVAIYLTNGKTGVQVAAATGKASTADAGFDFSRTTWGGGGGGGAYANTDIGKTITAAFADAYANLVRQAQAQPQKVAQVSKKK
ncbi:MAG: hypothetical protein ABI391_03575 [Hyphomicrobiaceae bacterium]